MSHSTPFSIPTRSQLCCALALAVMASGTVMAQSTAATLRGQAAANATVTATNTATGVSRSTTARQDGRYSLAGLPPGTYRVTGGGAAQDVTLQIGQDATLNLDTMTLETVTVVGTRVPVETRTSEVSRYVSTRQIEALPQAPLAEPHLMPSQARASVFHPEKSHPHGCVDSRCHPVLTLVPRDELLAQLRSFFPDHRQETDGLRLNGRDQLLNCDEALYECLLF